jgi:hypothetical protein
MLLVAFGAKKKKRKKKSSESGRGKTTDETDVR